MTTYLELEKCQLICSCKKPSPLCKLYFCQHCLDVRCSDCVSHEVDSYYCPNCLENMACAEAKMRKNRCSNCFDCPSCGHTLATRATAIVVQSDSPGQKPTAQKAYYLTCVFCRWTTRDSGIADQRQSAGGWNQPVNQHSERITQLIGSYRQLAVREKNERDLTRYTRRPQYQALLDRYPILNPRLSRHRSLWASPRKNKTEPPIKLPSAESTNQPSTGFESTLYTDQPLALEKTTNLIQRLLAIQPQPVDVHQLQPLAKPLLVKQSLRCRQCEHSLSKADFNPSSIKFRINRSAFYYVPDLRLILHPPVVGKKPTGQHQPAKVEWAIGKPHTVIITLSNPARQPTTVALRQLTSEEESELVIGAINESSLASDIQPITSENGLTTYSNVKLTLPDKAASFKLAPRSDAAEFDLPTGGAADPTTTGEASNDDPKIIAFRRANKLGIYASVTPLATTNDVDVKHLRAAVELTFDFKPTTTGLLPLPSRVTSSNRVIGSQPPTDTQPGEESATPTGGEGGGARIQSATSGDRDTLYSVKLLALLQFDQLASPTA